MMAFRQTFADASNVASHLEMKNAPDLASGALTSRRFGSLHRLGRGHGDPLETVGIPAEQATVDLTLAVFEFDTVAGRVQVPHFAFLGGWDMQSADNFLQRTKHSFTSLKN
jgi:hypothetical protein